MNIIKQLNYLVSETVYLPNITRYLVTSKVGGSLASWNCARASIQPARYFSGLQKMDGDYDPSVPLGEAQENGANKKAKGGKRLSVERIYQKKSQLEHILLRPDTYIGSVQHVTEKMWVLDEVSFLYRISVPLYCDQFYFIIFSMILCILKLLIYFRRQRQS